MTMSGTRIRLKYHSLHPAAGNGLQKAHVPRVPLLPGPVESPRPACLRAMIHDAARHVMESAEWAKAFVKTARSNRIHAVVAGW